MRSNFTHIASYDRALFRLSSNAERYFPGGPNTALIKLRQFGELLAQQVASRFGLYAGSEESQLELLRRLESNGDLERDVAELFTTCARQAMPPPIALRATTALRCKASRLLGNSAFGFTAPSAATLITAVALFSPHSLPRHSHRQVMKRLGKN